MVGDGVVIEVGSGAAALREAMAPTVTVLYDLYHAERLIDAPVADFCHHV
jgi:hypothetical protein